MANVPAWKDSKARRAVLGQMSVQMNVLDMVHVKLVDVFATLLGAVKDVLNLNQVSKYKAKERASRMEHCSYRHSDFY